MSDIAILTWVIGLGGTLFAVLMGVMWSYILHGQQGLYAFVTKIQDALKEEIDMITKQAREDAKDYDTRFARKEEVTKVEGAVNSMRMEMSNQFSALNTQMGGLASQMTSLATIITKSRI